MKKLKFTTMPAIALYAVLCLVFFSSCGEQWNDNDSMPDGAYIVNTTAKERFTDRKKMGIYKYEIQSIKDGDRRFIITMDLMAIGDTV